jgi:hypothetical protein
MKNTILAILLLLTFTAPAFCECDSKISADDTIGSVQKKLDCLAAENAVLKGSLAASRDEKAFIGLDALPYVFPLNQCMLKARNSAAAHGGTVVSEGQGYIAVHFGAAAGMIICQSMNPGYIIVAAKSTKEASDLKTSLRAEIFP